MKIFALHLTLWDPIIFSTPFNFFFINPSYINDQIYDQMSLQKIYRNYIFFYYKSILHYICKTNLILPSYL